MNNIIYPALFRKTEDGYEVKVPDIPECYATGTSIEQAYLNILDEIGKKIIGCPELNGLVHVPTNPEKIDVPEGWFMVAVDFVTVEYLRKHDTRTVKKTLLIPKWLNDYAVSKNINFSRILKKALIEELNLEEF